MLWKTVPRVVLEYTATLWACKARKRVMVVKGPAKLLCLEGPDSRLVADLLKERVSEAQECKVGAK